MREEIFDNHFTNEDTIALAINDTYFLDTGSNPLRFQMKKKIKKDNFWLKPTFVIEDEKIEFRKFYGPIGFRTWPRLETIRTKDAWSLEGAKMHV